MGKRGVKWLAMMCGALALLAGCEGPEAPTALAPHPQAAAGQPAGHSGAGGRQATVSWSAPTTSVDGAPLGEAPGFRVHIGRRSGVYDSVVDAGKATTFTLRDLEPDTTYYVAVTAYGASGRDSALSEEVVFSTGPGSEAAASPAGEGSYVIGTGREGGGYHTVGTRLKDVLVADAHPAEVVATAGSLENLERLSNPGSPVNVVFSQADALNYFLKGHSGLSDRFLTVDSWGNECVFIVTRRDSGLETDRDLQTRANTRLAILSPESGAAVTYRYMSELEPAFKNTHVVYMDTIKALEDLSGPDTPGEVDAVMLVQHPKARPEVMKRVLADFERYRFVQIRDDDLQDRLPDGSPVYSHVDITPEPISGIGVQTICTERLMLASREKLGTESAARLSAMVQQHWRDIYVAPLSAMDAAGTSSQRRR